MTTLAFAMAVDARESVFVLISATLSDARPFVLKMLAPGVDVALICTSTGAGAIALRVARLATCWDCGTGGVTAEDDSHKSMWALVDAKSTCGIVRVRTLGTLVSARATAGRACAARRVACLAHAFAAIPRSICRIWALFDT